MDTAREHLEERVNDHQIKREWRGFQFAMTVAAILLSWAASA
jgi:hypothetical protein